MVCSEPAGDGLQRVKAGKKRHTKCDRTHQPIQTSDKSIPDLLVEDLSRIAIHDSMGPECKVMRPECNEIDFIY